MIDNVSHVAIVKDHIIFGHLPKAQLWFLATQKKDQWLYCCGNKKALGRPSAKWT